MTSKNIENKSQNRQSDNANPSRALFQNSLDPLTLSSRFLRNPLRNILSYYLSNIVSQIPIVPDRIKKSLTRSAAKRDYTWLSKRLIYIDQIISAQIPKSSLAVDLRQYGPFRGKDRHKIAGMKWHVALLHSFRIPSSEVDRLPTISISFVTYNSAHWLEGLFSSLLSQDYPLNRINLYFVDNGSGDETVSIIESFKAKHNQKFNSVNLYRQGNLGFGMGHDVAFRASKDEFVLVSNVDLRFHPRTILDAVRAAEVDEADIASWELRQCPYEHPKYYDPVTLETMWSSYACILVRRDAYINVGGFEERIFMYGEDVELSYRLRAAGYRLRYLPQVTVTHYVDFEDSSQRPHQLTGSISANILLRYRYGDEQDIQIGERLLESAIAGEADPVRLSAFKIAKDAVKVNKEYFSTYRLPERDVEFPFNNFDYDIVRQGHDIPLDGPQLKQGPLVSIVTRTFGPNTFLLREAIASVCNQTYTHIEHIIVEDRTNFAADLVAELKIAYNRDLRYLYSKAGGRSAAGNAGLEHANGSLLMFLDNDDLLMADHVELLVKALRDNPSSPAAYSLGWEVPTYYDQNGRYREDVPYHVASHAGPFKMKRLQKGNFMPIQNVLFRRSIYDIYGGFDLDIDHLEDWNLWCRYAQGGEFTYVPKTTAMYRVPGDIILRKSREKVMLAAENSVRHKNMNFFK